LINRSANDSDFDVLHQSIETDFNMQYADFRKSRLGSGPARFLVECRKRRLKQGGPSPGVLNLGCWHPLGHQTQSERVSHSFPGSDTQN